MARLELFTNRFPFGSEFVEGEIGYLAGVFEEIVLVPARMISDQISGLPSNVSVDTSLAEAITPRSLGKRLRPVGRLLLRGHRSIFAMIHGWPGKSRIRRNGPFRCWYKQLVISVSDSYAVRKWALDRDPPDMAYTYWLGATSIGLRNTWNSVLLVSRAHGYDIYAEQSGLFDLPFHDAIVGAYDYVNCVSQHGTDYLRSRYEGGRPKFFTERLGIEDLGGLASEPQQGIRILSISSVDHNKRVDRIAEVVNAIAKRGHKVSWIHAGDGPDMSKVLASTRGFHSNATAVMLGQISRQSVKDLLLRGRFSVFMNQSLSEGCPVSIMEAQCVGMATVATKSGGMSEVMSTDGNVLHAIDAPIRDVAEYVISAAQFSKPMACNRRAYWAEHFNAAVNYPQFATKLRDAAN